MNTDESCEFKLQSPNRRWSNFFFFFKSSYKYKNTDFSQLQSNHEFIPLLLWCVTQTSHNYTAGRETISKLTLILNFISSGSAVCGCSVSSVLRRPEREKRGQRLSIDAEHKLLTVLSLWDKLSLPLSCCFPVVKIKDLTVLLRMQSSLAGLLSRLFFFSPAVPSPLQPSVEKWATR